MVFDSLTIAGIVLSLAVLLALDALFGALGGRRQRRAVNRRLQMRADGRGSEDIMTTLRRQGPDGDGSLLAGLAPVRRLGAMLSAAGMPLSPVRLALLMAAASGGITLLLIAAQRMDPLSAVAFGGGLGCVVPLIALKVAAARRIRRFNAQLPDALDMVVRSLRAGHPTTAALKLVAEQMPDPIGSEFGLVVDEMTYGMDLREALESMSRRLPSHDLHFMISAIRLQSTSGGNLTEVLGSLARVIRERGRFGLRVKALSAQARFSAWGITAAPFFVFGALKLARPNYFDGVSEDPLFDPMLGGALAGLMLGVVIIFKLVRFRY